LKRQGHQAIRGGTLESAVHIYNQTFSEEVQGRYSDLEEVKKNRFILNFCKRVEKKFEISEHTLRNAFWMHFMMRDAHFIAETPQMLSYLHREKLTVRDLIERLNYFSVDKDSEETILKVMKIMIARTLSIVREKLPSRWLVCHRNCPEPGCEENIFGIDGINSVNHACCAIPSACLPDLGFNNPDSSRIFKICAADPLRGNQYADSAPFCNRHRWFKETLSELKKEKWEDSFRSETYYLKFVSSGCEMVHFKRFVMFGLSPRK
jgi:hypothetical protein